MSPDFIRQSKLNCKEVDVLIKDDVRPPSKQRPGTRQGHKAVWLSDSLSSMSESSEGFLKYKEGRVMLAGSSVIT